MNSDVRWSDLLDGVDSATDRVVATARGLSEDDLRAPSLLPGWSRGHVLAHLALNADALGNLVTWAATGVETSAYVSSQARDADIENASGGSVATLVDGLVQSSARLRDGLAALPEAEREHQVALRDGTLFAAHGIPSVRVREIEIHHVDLAAGYRPADWPERFVNRTLTQLAPTFAKRGDAGAHLLVADDGGEWTVGPATGPTLHGTRVDLLVWLIGRALPVDLRAVDGSGDAADVPPSPQW